MTEQLTDHAAESEVTRLTEALAAAELAECERQNCCGLIEQKAFAEARVRELTEALAATEYRAEQLDADRRTWLESSRAAEARVRALEDELAALRAEVERLRELESDLHAQALETVKERCQARDMREVHAEARRGYAERVGGLEQQLAAANALLERAGAHSIGPILRQDIDTYLATRSAKETP